MIAGPAPVETDPRLNYHRCDHATYRDGRCRAQATASYIVKPYRGTVTSKIMWLCDEHGPKGDS